MEKKNDIIQKDDNWVKYEPLIGRGIRRIVKRVELNKLTFVIHHTVRALHSQYFKAKRPRNGSVADSRPDRWSGVSNKVETVCPKTSNLDYMQNA